jgi:protein TonB
MARLQARIDQQWDSYQKRPKRAQYGVSAQGYTFAQYVDDWRLKVERIGNLNYPEAAKREGIYGKLILEVCIKPNGNLYEEEGNTPIVTNSSGSKILDAAAIKIVRMAAPFPSFSSDMRAQMAKLDMEVFCITRGWTFTRSDQLTSQ